MSVRQESEHGVGDGEVVELGVDELSVARVHLLQLPILILSLIFVGVDAHLGHKHKQLIHHTVYCSHKTVKHIAIARCNTQCHQ